MFIGNAFTSYSVSNAAIPPSEVTKVKISDCIIDEFYAENDVLVSFDWNIPQEWGVNTALHAKYQNTMKAGNIDYTGETVTDVKIKKRYVGEFDWRTIYIQDIKTNDDFQVTFYDFFSPTGKAIEYAYVLNVGGEDIIAVTNVITPEFDSYFICGPNGETYPMILNVENTPTYNRESSIIKTMGRKYPYVNHNGLSQYYSGNINVSFIALDENCRFDTDNAWKYRNEFDQFLANGEQKILKSFEGDIWLVDVVNSIPRSNSGHYQLVDQQIEWVEVGDPYSIGDLYDNGFINTDIDRE